MKPYTEVFDQLKAEGYKITHTALNDDNIVVCADNPLEFYGAELWECEGKPSVVVWWSGRGKQENAQVFQQVNQ